MAFALLWLAGNALRLTILAVPPVLPVIHSSLGLTETEVGALSNLPTVLLAVGAVSGSLLIARLGARRALVFGLITIGVAGGVRVIGPSVPVLFGATVVMGMGIAVSQPALPSLVRLWLPSRAAAATAIYSNGFLVGEIAGAALTAPLLVTLLGGWRPALAVWSLPVLATALAVVLATRGTTPSHQRSDASRRWWPDWHDPLTWKLGSILGCASAAYFGCNAFIPDYLKATNHGSLIAPALTALNVGQLPASFIVAGFSSRLLSRSWPLAGAGFIMALATAGFFLGGAWVVGWAAIMGFGSAFVFVLTLALPPTLAEPDAVHRLTAAMFTISYTFPFVASILGGVLWDATSTPGLAFVPVLAAAIVLLVMAHGLRVAPA